MSSRIEYRTIVPTRLEPLRPDQHVPQVDEQGDRQDQFENIRDAHIRSNHLTVAKKSAKYATEIRTITTSGTSSPLRSHPPTLGAGSKGTCKEGGLGPMGFIRVGTAPSSR